MSASPSPTAARMNRRRTTRTRRAMKVGRSPKSVNLTPFAGRGRERPRCSWWPPSVSACASHVPSGDNAGLTICQIGTREAGMRASSPERPHILRACGPDLRTPACRRRVGSATRVVHREPSSRAIHVAQLFSVVTVTAAPPSAGIFSSRRPGADSRGVVQPERRRSTMSGPSPGVATSRKLLPSGIHQPKPPDVKPALRVCRRRRNSTGHRATTPGPHRHRSGVPLVRNAAKVAAPRC